LVLVAEQTGGHNWNVSEVNGRVTGRWIGDVTGTASIIERLGLTEAGLVEALVWVTAETEGTMYPERLQASVVPAFTLPRLLTLSAFAPPDWHRYIVMEGDVCGLVTRLPEGLFHYMQGCVRTTLAAGIQLGYRKAVVAGDPISAAECESVVQLYEHDWVSGGAARLVRTLLANTGVSVRPSEEGTVLQLAVSRQTSYEIVHTGRGAFDPEDDTIECISGARPVIFAIDSTIGAIYGDTIAKYSGLRLNCLGSTLVDGCESAKTWLQVERICTEAAHAELPRNGILIGVGGGVALDVAGLAASVYRRGVDYVRVPTTLVGIIDVAVGVKQAVNFLGRKNLLGAFYAPLAGVLDLGFLRTLPTQHLLCGFAEMIKLAMVRDAGLFAMLEQYALPLLRSRFQEPEEIGRKMALRAAHGMLTELQKDLFESVHARLPDFGHTFSPAMESATGYSLPHGRAVAADMLLTTVLAVERGICPVDVLDRLSMLYQKLGLLSVPGVCTMGLLTRAMADARLHRGGSLHLVAPTSAGSACLLNDVDAAEVASALRKTVRLCHSARAYAGFGF
jgi:3-dehydroquinate synthase